MSREGNGGNPRFFQFLTWVVVTQLCGYLIVNMYIYVLILIFILVFHNLNVS